MVNVSVCWSILNILDINSLENETLTTLSELNVNDVGFPEPFSPGIICNPDKKYERGVCYSCSEYNPYCQRCNSDFTCRRCANGYHLNNGICISLLYMNWID